MRRFPWCGPLTNNPSSPVEHTYETAKTLHAQGRLAEAERLYRDLIAVAPGHLGLLQRLGEICYRTGRIAEAAEFTRRAVEVRPGDAKMLGNLGVMLHQIKRNREALPYLEQALTLQPGSALIHTNLGMVLASLDRAAEALAHFNKAAELDPRLAGPYNNIGNLLSSQKRFSEAAAAFRKALALEPHLVEAWNNLGNAEFHCGHYDEAVRSFERALALDPGFAAAHYNWGTLLGELGHHEAALEHYLAARQRNPSHVATCNNLGRSLNALGRPGEAVAVFCEAIALDPDCALAHAGLGSAYLFLGRMEEARRACEMAVALDTGDPAVHRAYSETRRFKSGDPEIAALEAIAARDGELDDRERTELYFAMGKVYGDCGDHQRAFDSLQKGNCAKRRLIAYDEAANLDEMARMAALFTPELVGAEKGGDPSELPIFVLGMPRSGTTLIEQILASHPKVFGAGESAAFGHAVMGGYRPDQPRPDFAALSGDDLKALGSRYIEQMQAMLPSGVRRFTDKMPANFRFAGPIHMTLPRARIIHVRRDPLDTCFSCYSKLFNGALDFTYDLAELGRYYRAYRALMDHWRRVLPEHVMLDVDYEELVNDLDAGARAIVAFCGLDWDAQCLKFHETDRPVITASTAQVRQPLYKTSIGRWRPYAPWLDPLRQALGE